MTRFPFHPPTKECGKERKSFQWPGMQSCLGEVLPPLSTPLHVSTHNAASAMGSSADIRKTIQPKKKNISHEKGRGHRNPSSSGKLRESPPTLLAPANLPFGIQWERADEGQRTETGGSKGLCDDSLKDWKEEDLPREGQSEWKHQGLYTFLTIPEKYRK